MNYLNESSNDLKQMLELVRDGVNNLQDLMDEYFEDHELAQESLEELKMFRTSLPSYSAFSEIIELVEEENGNDK